jgi:hypothetical protein
MMERDTRLVALWMMSILAPSLYVVGLLSPLTPSAGRPGVGELAVFVAIPLVLNLAVVTMTRSRAVRVLLLAESAGIVAFTVYLLRIQDHP